MFLRDRDMNTAWSAASDGTLEKRHYYCQNWRADVSAIVTDTGKMVEWVKYSAYGVPFSLPSGDTDSDLDWDATDSAAMTGSYDVRKDADLDGHVDAADATHANSIKPGTGYQTLGRGVLSSTGVENRKSYAGYEYDPTFKGAGRVIMHVRHRVYDAELGRWTRRDPAGYCDGVSQYNTFSANGITRTDATGLDDAIHVGIGENPGETWRVNPRICADLFPTYSICTACCDASQQPPGWIAECRRICRQDHDPCASPELIREDCGVPDCLYTHQTGMALDTIPQGGACFGPCYVGVTSHYACARTCVQTC